jgi:carboxymethylenebutenolidase
MTTTRTDTIATPDGSFAAHVALPESGTGPALVVIQEIFGVNTYIRDVCDRVAGLGYVAIAPDMFWRQEPGFTVEPDEGEDGMNRAFAKMGGHDFATMTGDLEALFAHAAAMPECTGAVAIMGFCFGGTVSFLAAADLDPACAVSYYGSGVAGALDAKADAVSCPILFHFGDDDPYLPNSDAEAVAARFADVETATIVVQPGAGHAFDNSFNPMFSNPDAAAAAWQHTMDFLGRHLPVG